MFVYFSICSTHISLKSKLCYTYKQSIPRRQTLIEIQRYGCWCWRYSSGKNIEILFFVNSTVCLQKQKGFSWSSNKIFFSKICTIMMLYVSNFCWENADYAWEQAYYIIYSELKMMKKLVDAKKGGNFIVSLNHLLEHIFYCFFKTIEQFLIQV